MFGSYGAYKGGRGSDKEGVLSGWNGDGIKVNRAGRSRLSLSHDASSIAGAIQPGKLLNIMGDLEDEQGEWARFLWYLAPLRPFRLPDDDTRFEVGGLLEGIYRKLDKLAPIQYRFTPDAQQAYQHWHWQLEQRKLKEPRQGMRAALAKMQGYTARIAGIVHILWETAAGKVPEPHIPVERVQAAKALAEFYLGQVQLIRSDAEAAQGELTPTLKTILEEARVLGQLTTRQAQSGCLRLSKHKAPQILELFRELEAMGYGRLVGKTLIPFERNAEIVEGVLKGCLTPPPAAGTTNFTSLQPQRGTDVETVETVERFAHFPETSLDNSVNEGSRLAVVEPESSNKVQQVQQVQQNHQSYT